MKFTVLVPTYKNGVVIRAAIDSVREQTHRDWELFVVSDGAPPETHAVVEEFAERDDRIRLFKFPKGERHGEASRHAALQQAQGEGVCYLSDDDFWFPDHLATMIGLLGEADFAHTRHTFITPHFEAISITPRLTDPKMRAAMLTEKTNIFSLTAAGHRMDAYRRLPVGWAPAPPDVWTDLNMWRKFIAADGIRFASSSTITALHFPRGGRISAQPDPAAEVLYWREVFRDPVMRDALRACFEDGKSKASLHQVASLAAGLRLPNPGGSVAKVLKAKQDEIDRMRATKTWRYTEGLRSMWSRVRALRNPPSAAAPQHSLRSPSGKMRVHVHTVCWNDMEILPYFFRHYEPWVERFYFFDDGSTDGSLEYLRQRKDVIVLRTPRSHPESWVLSAQTIHNAAWKRSIGKADWVVVTNVDEHLYHPNMLAYLARMHEAGVTALPAPGYQMVTRDQPAPDSELWRDHTFGVPDVMYSRMALFRPDCVQETNYGPGRHRARLTGDFVLPARDEIANLHYKYLGVERTLVRQKALGAKLGAMDRANGWGGQYYANDGGFRAQFNDLLAASIDVSKVAEHNPALCWWRT
jgi:glycosyltransferase involved in cell wall biosynthesis